MGWQISKNLSTSWPGQPAGGLGSPLRFTTGKIAIKNRARMMYFPHSQSAYHRMIELGEALRDDLVQKRSKSEEYKCKRECGPVLVINS